ncbi:hypothetical protein CRENBAI_002782 [Crenichthys baileyi]|uniref:Uncharacterized protein n=1 Tax=Crenichthys baileyi TaxID=28760 RepID=A0AAV9QRZ7_9TELE
MGAREVVPWRHRVQADREGGRGLKASDKGGLEAGSEGTLEVQKKPGLETGKTQDVAQKNGALAPGIQDGALAIETHGRALKTGSQQTGAQIETGSWSTGCREPRRGS